MFVEGPAGADLTSPPIVLGHGGLHPSVDLRAHLPGRGRSLLLLLGAFFLERLAAFSLRSGLPLLLHSELGLVPETVAELFAPTRYAGLAGLILAAALALRWRPKPVTIGAAALIVIADLLLMVPALGGARIGLILAFSGASAFGFGVCLIAAELLDQSSSNRRLAFFLIGFTLTAELSGFVGPMLNTIVSDRLGSNVTLWLSAAALAAAILCLAAIGAPRRPPIVPMEQPRSPLPIVIILSIAAVGCIAANQMSGLIPLDSPLPDVSQGVMVTLVGLGAGVAAPVALCLLLFRRRARVDATRVVGLAAIVGGLAALPLMLGAYARTEVALAMLLLVSGAVPALTWASVAFIVTLRSRRVRLIALTSWLALPALLGLAHEWWAVVEERIPYNHWAGWAVGGGLCLLFVRRTAADSQDSDAQATEPDRVSWRN